MRRYLCALIAFGGLVPAAHAQELPKMYVFSEAEEDGLSDCGFRYASAVAAVQSELRRNNVEIIKREERFDGPTLLVYLSANGFKTSSTYCVVSYELQMYHYQSIFNVLKGELDDAIVETCKKGGLLHFPPYDTQTRINDRFRDYATQCISEYLAE